MDAQVNKERYSFERYVDKGRWMSYYCQLENAIRTQFDSYLIIGVGDGIVPKLIELLTEGRAVVDTFDFDRELKPTYCGDVRNIENIVNKKYECVVCCQVLEHIPYKHFESIIKSISKICSQKFILSLPVARVFYSTLTFELPFIHKMGISVVIPSIFKKFPECGEHRWELRTINHSIYRIKKVINRYFTVSKDMYVRENTYHYFFICNSKAL